MDGEGRESGFRDVFSRASHTPPVALASSSRCLGLALTLDVHAPLPPPSRHHDDDCAPSPAAFFAYRHRHRRRNFSRFSSLLGSLWQLFRGRKRNVLRCRVDTCMYDACQLLLGTLVFTVLSFLTPTISVYYTFFCIVQAVAVGVQVCVRVRQRASCVCWKLTFWYVAVHVEVYM